MSESVSGQASEKKPLELSANVSVYMGFDWEFDQADTVVFGAPFDSTTSFRPGTRFGSDAIRRESYGLETYSPYQDRDLEDSRVMDAGDLELGFGDPRRALADIEEWRPRFSMQENGPSYWEESISSPSAASELYTENIRMYISFTLTPTPISGRIIWESPCPTPASSGGAGSLQETEKSSSLESDPESAGSLSGRRSTHP